MMPAQPFNFNAADRLERELGSALRTAFIDRAALSSPDLRTDLLVNDSARGMKVLSALEDELAKAESFSMSVAFVTLGGVVPLLQVLSELEARGVPGRILASDYLNFTEPRALERLAKLKNLKVRLYRTGRAEAGFHTKGYFFERGETCRLIVGSSNLTQAALTTNREWNARLVAKREGEVARRMLDEFDSLWEDPASEPVFRALETYREAFERARRTRAALVRPAASNAPRLEPNAMQREFVSNVLEHVRRGAQKGLLISATGTGKTYASAFAVRALLEDVWGAATHIGHRPRVLFLVHREQIARQACKSYQRVLGERRTYGLFSGGSRSLADRSADLVFSTVQSMVRHSDEFDSQAFDIIVMDEVHRAGAESYGRIMAHFSPRFWLGMTASPDRPDGFDIYGLFDHSILYELRLEGALRENLLCPFHYFGISELTVGGVAIDYRDFNALTSKARVRHVLEKARYFGYSGERVKGLVFCSRNDEAEALAKSFREEGIRAVALSGSDAQEARERAIDRLVGPDGPGALDYILTVDIFNEGVDIPDVNQVVLLRPTESPIVFIQQLGRGLRRAPGKDFVVVLDFIGNCDNNYLIPVALSGDRSYSKDRMRRTVLTSSRLIPGASSIHFDEVSRERIFEAIDRAKTNSKTLLCEAYRLLKHKLGVVPRLVDFETHASVDAAKFFEVFGSYHAFLEKYEKDEREKISVLTLEAKQVLAYASQRFGRGERPDELIVLERLLTEKTGLRAALAAELERLGCTVTLERLESTRRLLTNNFALKESERAKTKYAIFLEPQGGVAPDGSFPEGAEWCRAAGFERILAEAPALTLELLELVRFARKRAERLYTLDYRGTALTLNAAYSYSDVCRLLNWSRNLNAQNIGGYFYDADTKTLPVFINYEKDDQAIAYHDRFLSENALLALSKTKRRTTSSDADHIYRRTEADRANRLFLFVRKNKDDREAKRFYFLGEIHPEGTPQEVWIESSAKTEEAENTGITGDAQNSEALQNKAEETAKSRKERAFEIRYRLVDAVRPDLYDYLTA